METLEQRELANSRSCPQCGRKGVTSIEDLVTRASQRSCSRGHTWWSAAAVLQAENAILHDCGRFSRMLTKKDSTYDETRHEINELAANRPNCR